MTRLNSLHLGYNNISNVAPLSGLNLSALLLYYNSISDSNLDDLSNMTSLTLLDLVTALAKKL